MLPPLSAIVDIVLIVVVVLVVGCLADMVVVGRGRVASVALIAKASRGEASSDVVKIVTRGVCWHQTFKVSSRVHGSHQLHKISLEIQHYPFAELTLCCTA